MRLLKYLKNKYKNYGSREMKRALEKGACLVNGKIERFGSKLVDPTKDKIEFKEINFIAREKLLIKKERIIFEDNWILIYDKEAGYPALPTEGKNTNLQEELQKFFADKFSLEPVHRLDKDTSGLMIFAKDHNTVKAFNEMFKEKGIEKTYLAIADGNWKPAMKGRFDNYLCLEFKRGAMQKWQVAKVDEEKIANNKSKYKQAITDYEVLKKFDKYTLVKLMPKTGRTHQLRVQLSDIGYPILGDTVYATKFQASILPGRHLLHAQTLKFNHPITKKNIQVEAPTPKEFEKLIAN